MAHPTVPAPKPRLSSVAFLCVPRCPLWWAFGYDVRQTIYERASYLCSANLRNWFSRTFPMNCDCNL
jgi:hypothetical protein